MSIHITNEIVDIPLNGGIVKGILNGDESSWNFQSLNKDFMVLFPTGIVFSHTYLDTSTLHYEHHKFRMELAAKVNELVAERRTNTATWQRMGRPNYTTRRVAVR
jgi:hypothetical protein